jgi:energy-coupling factor transporter ATP-binding protein EcfA2
MRLGAEKAVPDQAPQSDRPLVEVDDLHVRFVDHDETVWAVNGVSFALMPGEVLCIIGESGCGKSVTMRALMRLLPGKRTVIRGRIKVGQYDIVPRAHRHKRYRPARGLRSGLRSGPCASTKACSNSTLPCSAFRLSSRRLCSSSSSE